MNLQIYRRQNPWAKIITCPLAASKKKAEKEVYFYILIFSEKNKKNLKNVKKELTFSANRTASFSVQDFTLIERKTGWFNERILGAMTVSCCKTG